MAIVFWRWYRYDIRTRVRRFQRPLAFVFPLFLIGGLLSAFHQTGDPSRQAQRDLSSGADALRSGDPVKAVVYLRQASLLDPKLSGVHLLYGQALLETGDITAAEMEFRAGVEAQPNDFRGQLKIAQISVIRHHAEAALEAATAAHSLRPADPEARLVLAQALAQSGRPAEALALLQRSTNDQQPEVHKALAAVYWQLHRNAEAKEEQELADSLRDLQQAATDPGPATGIAAPDFSLQQLSRSDEISLAEWRGKPAVLIFGSYSCPFFRDQAPLLVQLSNQYGSRARFLLVYVREAHDDQTWKSTRNTRENIQVQPIRSDSERHAVAARCTRSLQLPFPVAVDGMDNRVEKLYNAWPSRLYLLDGSGRIAYQTRLSPLSFDAEDLTAHLSQLTGK